MLRLIAGIEAPDDGEVTVIADGGIGHLGQILGLPAAHTVQQAIDTALAHLRAMEFRMRELEADLTEDRLTEYGDVLAAYEARGGYEAEARTESRSTASASPTSVGIAGSAACPAVSRHGSGWPAYARLFISQTTVTHHLSSICTMQSSASQTGSNSWSTPSPTNSPRCRKKLKGQPCESRRKPFARKRRKDAKVDPPEKPKVLNFASLRLFARKVLVNSQSYTIQP